MLLDFVLGFFRIVGLIAAGLFFTYATTKGLIRLSDRPWRKAGGRWA